MSEGRICIYGEVCLDREIEVTAREQNVDLGQCIQINEKMDRKETILINK